MLANLVRRGAPVEERSTHRSMSWNDYVRLVQTQFSFNGNTYAMNSGKPHEAAEAAYIANSPVSSLIAVRALVFSEVRFSFQRFDQIGRAHV